MSSRHSATIAPIGQAEEVHSRPLLYPISTAKNSETRRCSNKRQRKWIASQAAQIRDWLQEHASETDSPEYQEHLSRLQMYACRLQELEALAAAARAANSVPRQPPAVLPVIDPFDLIGLPTWKVRWVLRYEDPEAYRQGKKIQEQQNATRRRRQREKQAELTIAELVTVTPDDAKPARLTAMSELLQSRRKSRGAV